MDVLLDEFDAHEGSPFFLPGEEKLAAMTKQIKTLKGKLDNRKVYKADGIVCHQNGLELMLLETAGSFKSNDAAKATFDNSKGMFGLLAMLKTIADRYHFASCESFKKLKLLFLQPSGKKHTVLVKSHSSFAYSLFLFPHKIPISGYGK